MPEIMNQIFELLGVGLTAPTNLAELIPWIVRIVISVGFVSFVLGTVRSAVFTMGKGI